MLAYRNVLQLLTGKVNKNVNTKCMDYKGKEKLFFRNITNPKLPTLKASMGSISDAERQMELKFSSKICLSF
jgi:hypothetical protein